MRGSWFKAVFLIAGMAMLSPFAQAQKKKNPAPPDPHDAIEVVGHIATTKSAVTSFLATQHYSSYYLYAEHEGGKGVTLIDITNAEKPVVLSDVTYPSQGSATIFAVAGTAALVSDQQPKTTSSPAGQTIRIMDFSHPQHPKVARQFDGVTTMSRDERRGLIFIANAEGVWILHQTFAEDPAVKKAYDDYITYSR